MKTMLPFVVDIIREHETNDPNELAAHLNITVKYVPLLGVKGVYLKFANIQVIAIEEKLNADERNVVLAHEIGHLYLHKKGYSVFDIDILPQHEKAQKEFEANKFAFLLISHTCLRNNPRMIDGIRNEQHLSVADVVRLLREFSETACYI